MRTRIVKGTMNISSDGDIEFHTFGGDLTFSAGGKNEWTSPQTIVGAYEPIDVEDFPPENEKNKAGSIIAFIKPTISYKGEFGIDYCEMNKDLTEITKIQGTDISAIEYIFDENTKQFKRATNIVEKYNAVKKLYHTKKYSEKEYYATWVFLSVGQTANLRLNTFFIDKSKKVKKNEEFITFGENPNFEIKYKGQTNNQIKIFVEKHNKEYDFEVKALKTFDTIEYIKIIDEKSNEIGVIEMSPNKVETLEVKVIPVVIKKTLPQDALNNIAMDLYNDVINSQKDGVNFIDVLNKHSFNQAGIQWILKDNYKIQNYRKTIDQMLIIDVQNEFRHYYDSTNNTFKDWRFNASETDPTKKPSIYKDEDGYSKYGQNDFVNDVSYLLDKLKEVYFDKYGKTFKGALIFVLEYDFSDTTIAYSKNTPIKNQGIIVFCKSERTKAGVYSHELGHLLGLEHTFIMNNKQLDELNNQIRDILRDKGNLESTISSNDYNIRERKTDIEKEKEKLNNTSDVSERQSIEEKIKKYEDELKEYEIRDEQLKRILPQKENIFIGDFRTKLGSTNNIMDYKDQTGFVFSKNQVKILRNDIHFYK